MGGCQPSTACHTQRHVARLPLQNGSLATYDLAAPPILEVHDIRTDNCGQLITLSGMLPNCDHVMVTRLSLTNQIMHQSHDHPSSIRSSISHVVIPYLQQ